MTNLVEPMILTGLSHTLTAALKVTIPPNPGCLGLEEPPPPPLLIRWSDALRWPCTGYVFRCPAPFALAYKQF